MTRQRTLWAAAALLVAAWPGAAAEPKAPPPPERYDVTLRYQINAFRNERLVKFAEMLQTLEKIGFQKKPGPDTEPEDRAANRMEGSVASAAARKLLLERHVRAALLVPQGVKLPEGEQPVRVDLGLKDGLPVERQRVLADQVRDVLKALGFREAVGYDNRGHTRLLGSVPAKQVEPLLNDLRTHPEVEKRPAPFLTTSPIVLIEARPDLPLPKERPPAPVAPKGQEKITPELRALLAGADAANARRLEVILRDTPRDRDDRGWIQELTRAAPGLVIEGRLGPLVTVSVPPSQTPALAALGSVSTVRLPRSGQPRVLSENVAADGRDALRASGLESLHAEGKRGRGTRIVVVDGDFRGWQALAGTKLPAATQFLDLTRERNRDFEPDPFAGDPNVLGQGTRHALAAVLAAPEAELTLVRVDPESPHQLAAAARYVNGEPFLSLGIDQRGQELQEDRDALDKRREELLVERRVVLDNFDSDDAALKRRGDYFKKQADFNRDERAYFERVRRFLRQQRDYRGLAGVRVVASGLVWVEGHPTDGSGALSRYFDDRPFCRAAWFQPAGDTRGQAWSGMFRDADGNRVMEFVPLGSALPGDAWSPELNFLSWWAARGEAARELPAGARLRLSVQWREAHEPEFANDREDFYRKPLAELRLVLLRQRDPDAAKQPADDLEVVAVSEEGLPQRLDNREGFSTYEQTLEVVVPEAGRYAVRVEGKAPEGTRPPGLPTLPSLNRVGELRPRVFVNTLDGPGRAVFENFATAGAIGMPGDARQVLTVGAADTSDRQRPYSADGPAWNLDLLPKPSVLSYDGLGLGEGTGVAAGFAAGLAASLRGENVPVGKFLHEVQAQPGGILRVPHAR